MEGWGVLALRISLAVIFVWFGILKPLGASSAARLVERVRGSHHIFAREGVAEILNLQPRGDGKAKPYQVKQVRTVIRKYELGGIEDEE